MTDAPRTRALAAVCVLAGLALLAALVGPFLLYGGVHSMHDLGEWYVPMRAFYASCLTNGDAFDWLPDVYCGYYLQGDGQVGMYHPLHWLLYRFLPLTLGVTIEMAFGYPVFFAGVFVLLRRRWRLDAGPAMFGALLATFTGYHLRHFEHINAIQVLAHIPWMLVFVDVALRAPSERLARNAAFGVGLLTASELLIGYPQYFWFSSFAEGCYALCLFASRRAFGRLVWLGAFKAVGVVCGAVQLLPTADLLSTSVRQHMSIAERSQWPLHPFELGNLVAPYATQQLTLAIFYPGVVAVVLCAWLALRRRATEMRGAVLAVTAVAGLCFVLALGEFGLLYRWHLELPVIGVFRMPYRYLALTSLGVAMLSAVALHALLRRAADIESAPAAGRRWLFALPILGVLALAGYAAVDASDRSFYIERHTGSYWRAALGIVGLTLAVVLVHALERGRRVAAVGLALLAAVDLGAFAYQFVYRDGLPPTLDEYRAAIPTPPDATGRALVAVANQNILVGYRTAGGYMPLVPDAPLLLEIDEHGERSLPHLRVAEVRWVQDEEGGSPWTQKSWAMHRLLTQSRMFEPVSDPLPRARCVASALCSDDPVAATATVDVARVAVVEISSIDAALDADGQPGSATLVADRPGAITVDVDVPTRQLLVVSERTRPGWTACVDGVPHAVVRTYGTFLGCVVEAGRHRIEFEFAPESLARGRFWSLGGLGGLLLMALIANLTVRRREP